ncbi:toxin-activating lysine-acyltransferase [Pseudomonas qingdaonensis]|nr:toxin-activating lysine-acyltransferase [Pseudomonas qingdaonensis]
MHSTAHRDAPLHSLATLLLPALKHRQFVLGSEAGKPVFYLSWLNLDGAAEQRYIQRSPVEMADADWNSGERLWINDFVAPFGHAATLARLVQRQLFPQPLHARPRPPGRSARPAGQDAPGDRRDSRTGQGLVCRSPAGTHSVTLTSGGLAPQMELQ